MTVLATLLEGARAGVCRLAYIHQVERRARRSGHAPGELVLGGRRVSVQRPRARTLDGHELTLPSWAVFASEDPLHERALEKMLVGLDAPIRPLAGGRAPRCADARHVEERGEPPLRRDGGGADGHVARPRSERG